MAVTLFADRFLLGAASHALDLVTGISVVLHDVTFDDRAQLHAWLQRCAAFMCLRSRPPVPVLDFGAAARGAYFEALAAQPGSVAEAVQPPLDLAPLLDRLAEVLDTGVSGRPRLVSLALPSRTPLVAALGLLGRESRLRGYIPVHPARLLASGAVAAGGALLAPVLHGRHVLVVHDAGARESAARLFLSLGLDSERPHVLLLLQSEAAYASTRRRHAGDAGDCAFAPRSPLRLPGGEATALRAREQQVSYGAVDSVSLLPVASGARVAEWARPAPGAELPRPRSKVRSALESAARGRHATAARILRETLSMCTRRGDLAEAADSALVLGRVLLTRGQVADASSSFEQARSFFERAGLLSRAATAALFVGLAWTDAGRWPEAEAAIRAALIAASALGDADVAAFGHLALSRCLLWQGRAREAADALPVQEAAAAGDRVCEAHAAPFEAPAWSPSTRLDDRVVRACLAARIAMALDDLRAASAAAATARERATVVGRPPELAIASTALASIYATLGDADATRVHVHEGLRAARLSHAPLRALRLRATLAEGLLRAGKASDARPLVARLSRLDLAHLPVVVRAPVERVLSWKGSARLATPLAACKAPSSDLVEAVVEILGYCQSIEDEETLARKVMAALRARVGAAVAACFGYADGRVAPIAADGRDPAPTDVAQRAAEAALAIAPGATASGLEAAVPVRAGGRVIGAVAARWPADVRPNWPAAGALFAAVSAAIAPPVRAVLDRRAVPPPAREGAAEDIVGGSEALRILRAEIERAARAPFNVVIEGESGVGKELVARGIHRLGPRRHHRLCAINCAALTDELLEAELFGHARGAFTGAVAERKGLFEEADGGSLVLDEVGELTPRAQAKLLRAIQEGEIRRLGENFSRPVDVRIIAASNRPLRPAACAGAFRRDLLYRLEVIRIVVPPLRERADDIPQLAAHFWQHATARLGSRATLAPATVAALARYDWPGNVRELQNVMAALAVAAGRRGSVGPERLPAAIAGEAAAAHAATLDEARRLFETRFVRAALARAGGRRAQAAKDLGLTRQGLAKLLARLGIVDVDVEELPAAAKP